MHILVTNDDGPPSTQSSPYILPFVATLEKQGHTVSVIIPDTQRSWIGKAHIVGQDVQATYYFPPASNPAVHSPSTTHDAPPLDSTSSPQPWVLVNSTPAGCAQLGLSHFFSSRGPVDLVISGPNYGRNTTAVFALSSGTLGAALEATVCGYRAVALSFAFFDRSNDAAAVDEACAQGARVCQFLAAREEHWKARGQLFSVNVPVRRGVRDSRVVWTRMLQNEWRRGACFQELPEMGAVDDPGSEEARLRRQESREGESGAGSGSVTPASEWRTRHFKWAPRFNDVYEWVEKAGPGSDGWAVKEGETSITALIANFMHADGFEGEVKL